ncbi:MAG: hypothetical protein KDI30_09925, partial [Pseudomonadales bacterium]|nr:hypothetical protein [Pseudomonadales bacterium]
GLDKNLCEKHWKLLLQNRDSVISKVIEVEERDSDRVSEDAETRLYDGFFTKADEGLFSRVRSANEQMLSSGVLHFSDDRLQELLFRYRARNFPASLSEDERRDWQNYRRKRLSGNHAVDLMTPEEYDSRIESLMTESKTDATRQGILRALQEWKAQLLQTV